MNNFAIDEQAILNQNVQKGLPSHVGSLVHIARYRRDNSNYDYEVKLPTGDYVFVKEPELNKLTDRKKELITYVKVGHHVEYIPTHEVVLILKTDFLHEMAEVEFADAGIQVVRMIALRKIEKKADSVEDLQHDKLGYFAELGLEVGKLVDEKQKAYGDSVTKCYEIMQVLLQDYHDVENHTYTIPESLLEIILLDVRKIDKLNRRFSNPDGDLMSENPFKDDVGYSLLGMRMVESVK